MGSCTSRCEASVTISAGPNTHYACFLAGLKLDLYQQKYGSYPLMATKTPCPPGKGVVDEYGVGTRFDYKTRKGGLEHLTITECTFTSGGTGILVMEHKYGYVITHTTTALSNGDCQYSLSMDGLLAGYFRNHMERDLNALKEFVQANVVAICNEVSKKKVMTPAVISVGAFCDSCGAGNKNRTHSCASCGASTTGGVLVLGVVDKTRGSL